MPVDEQHIISTYGNGRIGQAIAQEAKVLGATTILLDEDDANVHKLLAKLEDYKKNNIRRLFSSMRQIFLQSKVHQHYQSKAQLQ